MAETLQLPEADQRVPWSADWRSIRYRPDGQAAVLVGPASGPSNPLVSFRSGVSAPQVDVPAGIQIMEWDSSSGAVTTQASPNECGWSEPNGAWSPDSNTYMHVFYRNKTFSLYSYTSSAHDWRRILDLEWSSPSNPSWSGDSGEVAIASFLESDEIGGLPVNKTSPGSYVPGIHLMIIGADGSVRRSKALSASEHLAGTPAVGWNAESNKIAVAVSDADGGAGKTTWITILDAATLDVNDNQTIEAGLRTIERVPQWNDRGTSLMLNTTRGLFECSVSANGTMEPLSKLKVPDVIQATWCPDNRSILIFSREPASDIGELIETVARIGEGVTHRYAYTAYQYDAVTGDLRLLDDYRVTGRFDWRNAYMVPGVGEAFAKWQE